MLRDGWQCSGVMICGEVRRGVIHSVTMELIGKGREIADKKQTHVSCILICGQLRDSPEVLFEYGADNVILVQDDRLNFFNQEIVGKLLAHIIKERLPEIVLAPATTSGRTYLPAAAAYLHTGLTADCTGLDIEQGSGLLLQTRPAIGGNVIATIKTPDYIPQMATVRPKTFRVPDRKEKQGDILCLSLPDELFESKIEVIGMEYSEEAEANIQDKDVIVSGGKGLKRPENFELIRKLANLLNGGVGASRPTVEAKWIPYSHQVGLSGKVVSPKVYIAAGISGAVQHLAGMQTAQKIIAINKDPDALIFNISDIALCGDLTDILPRIIDKIEKGKREYEGEF